MTTWKEMSLDCLRAAKKLLDEGHLRSGISRAYYAAYGAVTHTLVERNVSFAHGWNNPAHEQLPVLVLKNTNWPSATRYQVNKALRILRQARENADYRPHANIDRTVTLSSVLSASDVLRILEIEDETDKA